MSHSYHSRFSDLKRRMRSIRRLRRARKMSKVQQARQIDTTPHTATPMVRQSTNRTNIVPLPTLPHSTTQVVTGNRTNANSVLLGRVIQFPVRNKCSCCGMERKS